MLNYRVNICELEYHVREKGWSLNWPTKFGLAKKTPLVTFLNHLLENTWVESRFPYGLSPYHEEAKRNTIGVVGGASVKLTHCTGPMLVYPMENEMPFVHHVVKRWGCGYTNDDKKA